MSVSARLSALTEGVFIALDSIRSNKVRAALTILGVAIGVFVVVIMSAAIHGINASVAKDFESAGPTTFFLNRFPITFEACDGTDETCKWRRNPAFTVSERIALERLETLEGVTMRVGTSAPIKYADRALPGVSTEAFTANWIEVSGGDIIAGRNFTPAENNAAARVILINDHAVKRLFSEGSEPVGKVVMVKDTPMEVIGVYQAAGSFFSGSEQARAVVPFESGRRYLGAWTEWADMAVRPGEGVARDIAIDDVTATLRGLRGLRPSEESNFAIITQDQLFETWGKLTDMFFLVMFALSAVGLMVGGVGVVAIMMISVTERTREIGVRKALGATRLTILWQFLIEAVTLTGIGALFGLGFGWIMSLVIRSSTPIPASIPPGAIVAALGVSALTGILFGMLPAARAARLDPVAALRHE